MGKMRCVIRSPLRLRPSPRRAELICLDQTTFGRLEYVYGLEHRCV